MIKIAHRLPCMMLYLRRYSLRFSHTKSPALKTYDDSKRGILKNIEKFYTFNVAEDGSLLQKEANKWSNDGGDYDDDLDLNLSLSSELNRETDPKKHHIKDIKPTTATKNEAFFTDILKRKYPRKYYYLQKVKRKPTNLEKFDLGKPVCREKNIELKTSFTSSSDFNNYINELISYKYPNEQAINENILYIIKHIPLFQSVVNVDSFNLLIRHLGRRNKWERTFKLLNIMKTMNIIPNKETVLWLIRNCCYYQNKNKRLQQIKSVLYLGIIEWKIELYGEIKLMLWLALPYSGYWLQLNSILINEGLQTIMHYHLVKTHYVRNMATHYFHIKKQSATSSFFHIKAQIEKHKLQDSIENDLIIKELITCLLRQADVKGALLFLKSKSIQSRQFCYSQHGCRIIQWHLDNVQLPLVHAVVAMNELIKFSPDLKRDKPHLVLPIFNYIKNSSDENGDEIIALLEGNAESQIWNLRWKKNKIWHFENELDPVHLRLIDKLYQLGK